MPVLVSDTSVLIDLERGSFLEHVFRLPFEFAVPDLLYEYELKDHGGPMLIDMGLRVEELDGVEVALALAYRRERRSLSLPDSFALALSRTRSWMLLSGDRSLRALADEKMVECHGVLWLLDQLHEHRILDAKAMTGGLQRIAEHPRCRLPQKEIQDRLRKYSSS
ncbi:MAG: hypothetical protein F4Y22_05275 [Gammaproteobacteria bacterium]|nr:hypothetical protein [Gammaproteobacteria bacterium]MYH46842.1 hypothetical protein [Gammaproteobacteria bacterium]MYL13558.1 hypothetical protein [Gammaproteobacteria bacterium]